jgi:hypothetical protein
MKIFERITSVTMDPTIQKPEWLVYRAHTLVYTRFARRAQTGEGSARLVGAGCWTPKLSSD